VRAAGVEEEQPPRVLAGIEEAFHARIEGDAAARIAVADEVNVRVPDLRRVESFPRGANEVVIGEAARQRGAAGIPESLLRPEAPGDEAGSGGAGAETR